jgi:hypothetical protein
MADTNIGIDNDRLVKHLAYYLGWGRTAWANLSAAQQDRMTDIISGGKRQFYSPPLLQGDAVAHVWSFLTPYTTLNLYYDSGASMAGCAGTTLTDASESFTSHMFGATVTFDTSGTSYTIVTVDSDTQLTLDAAADADDGDTYTIHGHSIFDLPAGFGGVIGNYLTYVESTSVSNQIQIVSESQIRVSQQRVPSCASRPYEAASRIKTNDGSNVNAYELAVFPTPDTNTYVVGYQYFIVPETLVHDLSVTSEVPLGASIYGEALLASCKAYAELDEMGERGVRWEEWMAQLAKSIQLDRRTMAPETFGYCGDNSDILGVRGRGRADDLYVTFEGVRY